MRTIAIIQARTGSTRLPGKVLADVAGQPVLWHVVHRALRARAVDQVVVATTGLEEDAAIGKLCRAWQVPSFGWVGVPPHDVLMRYVATARTMAGPGDRIVRITADCPLIDPDVIDATVDLVRDGVSWASNVAPRTWPDGLDVEALTFDRLMTLDRMTTAPADREHVTPQLYAAEQLHGEGGALRCPVDLHDLRWTIDTPEDMAWFRDLMAHAPWNIRWHDLLFRTPLANRRVA
jgi:spore coat polysaccharide biosynthesis protein SpsF (cytidylyltransferase family)